MNDFERGRGRPVARFAAVGLGWIFAVAVGPVLMVGFFLGYSAHEELSGSGITLDRSTLGLATVAYLGTAVYLLYRKFTRIRSGIEVTKRIEDILKSKKEDS